MLILVDSSCWIEFFRPRGNAYAQDTIRRWILDDQVVLCGPVRAEVLRGARKNEVKKIDETFAALRYLTTADTDWTEVAEKAQLLAGKGQHVPLIDLLIAIIAQRHGVAVAHADSHFSTIKKLVSVEMHDLTQSHT